MTSNDRDSATATGRAKLMFGCVAVSKAVRGQVIIASVKGDIFRFGVDHKVAVTHADGAQQVTSWSLREGVRTVYVTAPQWQFARYDVTSGEFAGSISCEIRFVQAIYICVRGDYFCGSIRDGRYQISLICDMAVFVRRSVEVPSKDPIPANDEKQKKKQRTSHRRRKISFRNSV